MFHADRVWCVAEATSAEELARQLTETTNCCCTAFALGNYLFLNDSTSPDGAQEYAVVKRLGRRGRLDQIESITFSWCDVAGALRYIREALAGHYDRHDFRREVAPVLQTPEQHGRCAHCA